MIEYLFVYGTLLTELDNNMSNYLRYNAQNIGRGFIYGKLFDIGDYPGAILNTNKSSKVFGNVFIMNSPQAVLSVLDEYEGVGSQFPQPNEYKRQLVDVQLNNSKLTCWAYLYNCSGVGLRCINTGCYIRYLQELKVNKEN